jgi:hypothetical protein
MGCLAMCSQLHVPPALFPGKQTPPPYRAVKRLGGLHMWSECFVDETIPLLSLRVEAGFLESNQQCHHCADRDVSPTVVLRSAVRLNQDRWKGVVHSVCVRGGLGWCNRTNVEFWGCAGSQICVGVVRLWAGVSWLAVSSQVSLL